MFTYSNTSFKSLNYSKGGVKNQLLANVRIIITDRKLVETNSLGTMATNNLNEIVANQTYFSPEVVGYNDYFAFGMLQADRHGASQAYRYGYQNQEKDDEVRGEGNSLNYTFRMADVRIGRFFAWCPWITSFWWSDC